MIYRCRQCETETTDPLDHLLATHPNLPSTMAQVWEGFALVGQEGKRTETLSGQLVLADPHESCDCAMCTRWRS